MCVAHDKLAKGQVQRVTRDANHERVMRWIESDRRPNSRMHTFEEREGPSPQADACLVHRGDRLMCADHSRHTRECALRITAAGGVPRE